MSSNFPVDSLSEKELNGVKDDTDDAGVSRVYDQATQEVLDVEFPTWYYSTHGLSRPSTPVEEDQQRSVQSALDISKSKFVSNY